MIACWTLHDSDGMTISTVMLNNWWEVGVQLSRPEIPSYFPQFVYFIPRTDNYTTYSHAVLCILLYGIWLANMGLSCKLLNNLIINCFVIIGCQDITIHHQLLPSCNVLGLSMHSQCNDVRVSLVRYGEYVTRKQLQF